VGKNRTKNLDHGEYDEKVEGEKRKKALIKPTHLVIPAQAGIQRVKSGAKRCKNQPPSRGRRPAESGSEGVGQLNFWKQIFDERTGFPLARE
jgi:hypothetical protein